jgi:hypothetical protein
MKCAKQKLKSLFHLLFTTARKMRRAKPKDKEDRMHNNYRHFENKNQTIFVFSYLTIKDVSFPIKKIRAAKMGPFALEK